MNNRLALGTVQFGTAYGTGSRAGQVCFDDAAEILQHALAAGLDTLDTAMAYGDSEQRLGRMGVGAWRVISKLPPMPDDCADVSGYVQRSVQGSLERLNLSSLYGMLLHRPYQLLGAQGDVLYRALLNLKTQGLVAKIGVSIYGPEELDSLCSRFAFDLIQSPFSIFDRRLATSGWLSRLHHSGIEIHTRSAFLQGQLLRAARDRPAGFARWNPLWDRWRGWLDEQALTPLQACLGFVMSRSEIDRVVIGVKNLNQLQEILASLKVSVAAPPATLMSEDVDLINPSRWPAD
ncbi:MAG: aldo/keto reductase [Betaproteobacteria bacterium]